MSTEQNERDLVTLSEQQNVRTFSTLKLIFPSAVVTKKSPKPPKIIAVKELRSFRVPGLTSEAKCHLGLLVIKKATYGVYMLSSERTPAIAARSKTSPYDEAQALALPTQIPVCVQAIPSDVKDAPYLYPSLNFTHLVKLNCASPTDLHSNPPALDPLVFYPELEHPSDRRPRTSRCRNLEQICEEHREYWRGARYGGVSGSDDGSGGDGGEDGAGNGGAAGDAGNGGADGDAGDGGAAGDAGDDGAAGRVGKDGNAWCGRGGVGDGGADRRDGGDGSVGNSGADEQDEIKGHASEFKSGREFLQYTLVLEGLVCDMDEGDSRIYSGANLEGISFEDPEGANILQAAWCLLGADPDTASPLPIKEYNGEVYALQAPGVSSEPPTDPKEYADWSAAFAKAVWDYHSVDWENDWKEDESYEGHTSEEEWSDG